MVRESCTIEDGHRMSPRVMIYDITDLVCNGEHKSMLEAAISGLQLAD